MEIASFQVVPYDSDIRHHGVLGQKWGVRRYQNSDGTLTALGRRRLGYDGPSATRSSAQVRADVHQLVKDDSRLLNSGLKSGVETTNRLNSMVDRSVSKKKQKAMSKVKVNELSNKDLQDYITRMNLEQQYKNLATSDISSGQSKVSSLLQTVGDILAVGASAAAIAAAIHELNK